MISSKTASALILELNQTDETEHLEAKECGGDSVGKSVYETICAMSNEPDLGGGTILLGVEKENSLFPSYTATGVRNPDKLQSDIASACAILFNIPVRVDLSVEMVGKARIVRIDVPELPRNQKPLYHRKHGLPRGAFRRSGPSDVHCTDEDLWAFFQNKSFEPYDSGIVEGASWEDIDPNAILAYRRTRAEANSLAEELNWSDEEVLHALGGVKIVGDKTKITVAGLIVFGRSLALRRLLPSHRIDYIRVPGNQWIADPDKHFETTDMRGPLLLIVSRVIAAIIDDLPKVLGIGENGTGQRSEIPAIPFRVV